MQFSSIPGCLWTLGVLQITKINIGNSLSPFLFHTRIQVVVDLLAQEVARPRLCRRLAVRRRFPNYACASPDAPASSLASAIHL
jgi:hypothetical protein